MCAAAGLSRQAYYKDRKARRHKAIDEEAILEVVRAERRLQPEIGGRKLLRIVGAELEDTGVRIGRDRFFELLRREGLLIGRKEARAPRTTWSAHGFRDYDNLLVDLVIRGPHEAWVSDITYVRTKEGFVYVFVITDRWSRKIVGYNAAVSLEAEGAVRALSMALGQLPEGKVPIHHSDRGIQYCCWQYVEILEGRGIRVSTTQENHCYENAVAERVNGILKQEYWLGETFETRSDAAEALRQAVWLYNTRRPHTSLEYRTPSEVHGAAA